MTKLASESSTVPTADDLVDEKRLLIQRRKKLGIDQAGEWVALALSGGGIRSATFSLGVVQAIAEAPLKEAPVGSFKASMLSKFDYLSTVSGGGYLGGFLCSLFLPGRLRLNDSGTATPVGWQAKASEWTVKIRRFSRWFSKGSQGGADKAEPQGVGRLSEQSHVMPGATEQLATQPAGDDSSTKPSAPESAMKQASKDASGGGLARSATMDNRAGTGFGEELNTPSPMLVAADDAFRVLRRGAPQRIRSDAAGYTGDLIFNAPLAWLRENGRYLLPTGSGDAIYVMALGLRNWISVHCVIGTVMLALVSVLMLLRAWAAQRWPSYGAWEQSLLEAARCAYLVQNSAFTDYIWWSTLSVLWMVPMLTCGLVLGTAFWLVHEDSKGRSGPFNQGVIAMGLIGLLLVWLAWLHWDEHFPALVVGDWNKLRADGYQHGEVVRMVVVLAVGAVTLGATLVYWLGVALWWPNAAKQRVLLTRGLSLTLASSLGIAAVAIIDTLGQTLYLAAAHGQGAASTLSPAGLAGALAWFGQRLAKKGSAKLPGGVRKLPLKSLAGIAGVVIFVLVGALWAMLVHMMIWGGNAPERGLLFGSNQPAILQWMLWVPIAIALATGLFPGFINMSSLQPFYGSRLTRAYLGASNGQRFHDTNLAKRSAAEPMASDQIRLEDYYANGEIKTLAPLHIINVCVNKTVDPAEQLVQRDRKGQPLAILPCGLALDSPEVRSFPRSQKRSLSTVDRPLSVGQWIGTSGAAFSTGIGRETTLGMSLLMGAANVRLGTWWPTGRGTAGAIPVPPTKRPASELLRKGIGLLFRTQRYLSYELRASFHGTHRTWQYLSDGGHFENTGLYELLRPERGVAQIFACDNGADSAYHFDDLANLIRLARIDLQIDVVVAEPPTTGPLGGLFGRPEDFKPFVRPSAATPASTAASSVASIPAPAAPVASASPGPIAVLLYASPIDQKKSKSGSTQIVLIKPHVTSGVPADVRQYAATHQSFPQEPTADQFFDEAQWESYRALGYHQARRIFTPAVLQALDADLKAKRSS